MNIPKRIVDAGGMVLEKYVRTSLELSTVKEELMTTYSNLAFIFYKLQNQLENYNGSDIYTNGRIEESYVLQQIVSRLKFEKPLEDIYMAEEFLKQAREFTLDIIVVEKKVASLQNELFYLQRNT